MDSQIIDKVCSYIRKGYSTTETANLLNISPSTVYHIRIDKGLETRERKPFPIPPEMQLQIAEDYFVNGKTQKEIIVDYHITYSNFMGVRKRFENKYEKKSRVNTVRVDEIKELLASGMTQTAIAKKLGLSRQRISVIVGRYIKQ